MELVSNRHLSSISCMKCRYVGGKYMHFMTANSRQLPSAPTWGLDPEPEPLYGQLAKDHSGSLCGSDNFLGDMGFGLRPAKVSGPGRRTPAMPSGLPEEQGRRTCVRIGTVTWRDVALVLRDESQRCLGAACVMCGSRHISGHQTTSSGTQPRSCLTSLPSTLPMRRRPGMSLT
jgi:hypothetical protein